MVRAHRPKSLTLEALAGKGTKVHQRIRLH
jgi:hypothetical protein